MSTTPKIHRTTHTPGPWTFHAGQFISAPGQVFVAEVWEEDIDIQLDAEAVMEANGRLIAAAPDFYREAKRVVEWLERLAAHCDERAKDSRFPALAAANAADAKNYRASAKGLKAAIAKAEGND